MLGAMSQGSWFNRPNYAYRGRAPLRVFVSYSHVDFDVAQRLAGLLTENGFDVIIDSRSLAPGESIQAFIQRSVAAAAATISIISKHSLFSAWVALESEEALHRQRKGFFGCYLDKAFLRREFGDEALEHIDLQIRDLSENIKRRIDKQQPFADLYGDLERYQLLRASLDKNIRRLRETACLSLEPAVFEESVKALVGALKRLEE